MIRYVFDVAGYRKGLEFYLVLRSSLRDIGDVSEDFVLHSSFFPAPEDVVAFDFLVGLFELIVLHAVGTKSVAVLKFWLSLGVNFDCVFLEDLAFSRYQIPGMEQSQGEKIHW